MVYGRILIHSIEAIAYLLSFNSLEMEIAVIGTLKTTPLSPFPRRSTIMEHIVTAYVCVALASPDAF